MSTATTVSPPNLLGNLHDLLGHLVPRGAAESDPRTGARLHSRPGAQETARERTAEPPRFDQESSPADSRDLQQLESHVVLIVRRAMRKEASTSSLTRRIQALARSLGGGDGYRPADPETLVRQVARSICHSLIKKQRP